MNLYYGIRIKIIKEKVSKDVKDIRCWNIFDIFFCLIYTLDIDEETNTYIVEFKDTKKLFIE